MDLIATTGGTGFAPRDCTPEATLAVATKNAPGIAEAMRLASLQVTPRAMLSRGASVIRNQTLIINLPGSPKAVKENLEAVLPSLEHGLAILTGNASECGKPLSAGNNVVIKEIRKRYVRDDRSIWKNNRISAHLCDRSL